MSGKPLDDDYAESSDADVADDSDFDQSWKPPARQSEEEGEHQHSLSRTSNTSTKSTKSTKSSKRCRSKSSSSESEPEAPARKKSLREVNANETEYEEEETGTQPNTNLPPRKGKPRPEKKKKRLSEAVSPHAPAKQRGEGNKTLRHSFWSEEERCAMLRVMLTQKEVLKTRQTKKSKNSRDAAFADILGKGDYLP